MQPIIPQQPKEQIVYNRNNPFLASISDNRRLNGRGSAKDTRHIVMNIEGSGFEYSAGDSLGVYPKNQMSDVHAIMRILGLTGEELVSLKGWEDPISVEIALTNHLSLSCPTRKMLALLNDKVTDAEEKKRLKELLHPEASEDIKNFLADRHFIDLLEEFPSARPNAQELVDRMRKLRPRLYSIASSSTLYSNEIHLTVGVVRYQSNGRDRTGVCSTYLGDRAPLNKRAIPVFLAKSHFGLPDNDSVDIIMIGPGTGIAPFRGFLQERMGRGATGRNWLFFGDQHYKTDFLYGDEMEKFHNDGVLNKLSLAWSRDQDQKVYVQDKMRESAAELWSWLQNGAYLYVCGDARRMARDVELMLVEMAMEFGRMTEMEGRNWLRYLRKDKRYQRDVY